ncbi:GNAT family N-acetyltransferase [Candidatus Omnitrophota bacterium]
MLKDMQIKPLESSEREAALHLLCEAFREHPMLPPGIPHETTQILFRFMFDEFGSKDSACFHGIKDTSDNLVCAALTLSNADEPGLWDAVRYTLSFFRILGWSLALSFLRVHASKPKRTTPHLELLLLGTLPSSQKGGLGRAMLRYLYRYAKDKGYVGITLEVVKNSPAYDFYCREGFVTDKTVYVKGMPLCLVHRKLDS